MPECFAVSMPDARADGALRQVSVSLQQVTICRRYQGIAMRLVVPCAQYRGIGLRQVKEGDYIRHEVALLHQDADLSVTLSCGADAPRAAQDCGRWADWFGLPQLRGARLAMGAPCQRRRTATLAKRRRRYALRRKMGFVSSACL